MGHFPLVVTRSFVFPRFQLQAVWFIFASELINQSTFIYILLNHIKIQLSIDAHWQPTTVSLMTLSPFGSDKMFPAFGFGAQIPPHYQVTRSPEFSVRRPRQLFFFLPSSLFPLLSRCHMTLQWILGRITQSVQVCCRKRAESLPGEVLEGEELVVSCSGDYSPFCSNWF